MGGEPRSTTALRWAPSPSLSPTPPPLLPCRTLTTTLCFLPPLLLSPPLQAAVNPPTFVFFVNEAKLFPEEYRRYMEKQLRKNIGFPGTPLRLLWRSKKRDANRGSSSSQSSD